MMTGKQHTEVSRGRGSRKCIKRNSSARSLRLHRDSIAIGRRFNDDNDVTLFRGDCRDLLRDVPLASVQLVVTSPPYNIGKRYERRVDLEDYLRREEEVISLCIDRLAPGGSICWQIGNRVDDGFRRDV